MRFETFTGPDLSSVYRQAREVLGDEAAVVDTRSVLTERGRQIRIVAVREGQVERFRARLEAGPLPGAGGATGSGGPMVVALVGPTGAGKTTTLAKLALSPRAFGGRRVGVLTLDTYRIGALEQIQTYAEVANLPLEVVYHAREARQALARLGDCDVVLVDTPGRGPRSSALELDWHGIVAELDAAETHLVLPATLRPDIAEAVRDAYDALSVSHVLLSKLDEVPGEAGVADLAHRLDLPARWVTDGQDVPADLRAAVPRILAALGRSVPTAAVGAAA